MMAIIHGQRKWITLTTQQGTVCWSIIRFVEESKTSTDDKNNNPTVDQEWGPEAAEAMCNEVRQFPVMSGNEANPWTLGDLIDHTPKDLISKVKLEEIVFETWFGGRTALMGDGMQVSDVFGIFSWMMAARHAS